MLPFIVHTAILIPSILFFCPLPRAESKPELVKTEMGPPPSPASTCSDTSSIASSASLPYSMSTPPPPLSRCYLKPLSLHAQTQFLLAGPVTPLTLKQMAQCLLPFWRLAFLLPYSTSKYVETVGKGGGIVFAFPVPERGRTFRPNCSKPQ